MIELTGIQLGQKFEENKFIIIDKETIPGGDYMVTIQNPCKIYNKYFKQTSVIYPMGGNEISMVVADNGGGYSRKDCLSIIDEINDNYLDRYGKYYDMYISENNRESSYMYYFYPKNYNVLSLKNIKSNKLKEPITQLLLWTYKKELEDYYTLEAVLSYFEDYEDDKTPEELDNTKQKPLLKVAGINL